MTMNRAERRAQQSQAKKAVQEVKRTAARLQAGPAGPWHKMTDEEFNTAMDRSLALQSAHRGVIGTRGPLLSQVDRAWYNNHYEVMARSFDCEYGRCDHFWIKRVDGKAVSSWSDKQRIKDELAERGGERTAVEVFPPTSEIFDQANWYHLWVYPVGFEIPFTLARSRL